MRQGMLFQSLRLDDFFICRQTLLARNATVYIAARNLEKSEAAIQVLSRETGKKAHYIPLDLADLESVRQAAATFQK
jgi:retinol dehydrogenase-12